MSQAPTNKMRKRIHLGVFIFFVVFAVYIIMSLFSTSVIKAEYYRSKANTQQLTELTINANRGTIYDVNGKVLAQSKTVWDVIVSPYDIDTYEDEEEKKLICKTLSEILDVDYDKLCLAVEDTNRRFYTVKTKVEKEVADEISAFVAENDFATYSVYLVENTARNYPNETLAASVIGFTNFDNNGVYGVEAYYDEYLQGVDGKIVSAQDASGGAMPYEYETRYEARNGNSVYLTIDEVVQHYLEKNLETVISQEGVDNRATGIIMNVKTGAILAMATAPGYDLNSPAELNGFFTEKLEEYRAELIEENAEREKPYTAEEIDELVEMQEGIYRETQWNNKAISELYFPGSVFKMLTCAAALEEEAVSLESEFYCSGVHDVSGTPISCWSEGGHGMLDLQLSLTKSCNPAFIQIGQALGADHFCEYFEAFGLTEKTGIDLPGEAQSLFVTRPNMGPVELASSSFGQTNKLTPLQMISACASVVNGGYLVTPHVMDKIVDDDGNVIMSYATETKRQVISEETSATMRNLLENVVIFNGGSNAYIEGYDIGGKSGTSEKLDEYSKANMRYVSSFCAFTPADDPEYIMLVMVDEPMNGKIYGSAVAAPVVSAVFSECLEYLGIYAQYTAEELAEQDTMVPYIIGQNSLGAITNLNYYGLNAVFVGNENGKVQSTTPGSGYSIPKGGTVVIYMDDAEKQSVIVPDVIGMTVSEANIALTNAGLNIRLSGGAVDNANATASLQSVEAGEEAYKGTVVEVTFIVNDETG